MISHLSKLYQSQYIYVIDMPRRTTKMIKLHPDQALIDLQNEVLFVIELLKYHRDDIIKSTPPR